MIKLQPYFCNAALVFCYLAYGKFIINPYILNQGVVFRVLYNLVTELKQTYSSRSQYQLNMKEKVKIN